MNNDITRPGSKFHAHKPGIYTEFWLAALVVAAALLVRAAYIDSRPFLVDEAESAINAFTILQSGYPSDTYLGQPIFENTLIERSPEDAEYEFRDLSYSDKHMAVYHGWLPLYSIAASFALNHIQPDQRDNSLHVKHDLQEQKRRTRAARFPAVLFGAVFLVFAFMGGRRLYGADAGWAALIVASIYPWHFNLCRQARYYSATIALTTACCVVLWLMLADGKWRHFLWGGVLFVLLFHTHLLSCFAACLVVLLSAPIILYRHPRGFWKLAVWSVIFAAGTVPWVLITHFYARQSRIPRGWSLLSLPGDLMNFPPFKLSYLIAGSLFTLFVLGMVLVKPRHLTRFTTPLRGVLPALVFLAVWVMCGYVSFLLFMPAASFFIERLEMSYWGPLLLLCSVVCAAAARIIAPRMSIIIAPVLFVLISYLTGHQIDWRAQYSTVAWNATEQVIDQIRSMPLATGTKFYTAPGDHLIWSVYTGLPFQSIAAVRKSYLDQYRAPIIYVDSGAFLKDDDVLKAEQIRRAALRYGEAISRDEARRWSELLQTRHYRESMQRNVMDAPDPRLEQVPEFAKRIVAGYRERERDEVHHFTSDLMTRGFDLASWTDWRAVFFYRFVDPDSRRGPRSNYAARLRGAHAQILLGPATVIYQSPWHSANLREGIEFEISP